MVESEAEKILSKITIPTYIRIRCRETIVIVRIKSTLNFMFVTGSVNMKAWSITRKSRIGKFDQDHIKRRNNGNSVKKRLHGIQQTVFVELCIISVFIANRRSVIFGKLNKFFTFGRLILKFFLSNERLRSKVRN